LTLVFNEWARPVLEDATSACEPLQLHRAMAGYAPTPLRELPALARDLGVARLWVKDESSRLGLPAFKILGASWAVHRALAQRAGATVPFDGGLEALREAIRPLPPFRLIAATDGNHGRSLARVAAELGLGARVLVPRGTARNRIRAIEEEGAEVTLVPGTYDEAVTQAAALSGPNTLLIQDTAWPGYEEVPGWIVEGYATMFHEIDVQLDELEAPAPDVVFLQVGAGSLASAAVRHYRRPERNHRATLIGVEPQAADCGLRSLRAGQSVTVPGPHGSILAGLNCGTLSSQAWPWLWRGLDAAISVDDERAGDAVRQLAAFDVESGESGAAGLAGLLELVRGGTAAARRRLGIDSEATVLLISTEGITDEVIYRRLLAASDRIGTH
jgi:diaminopropionate ammonia-lyase